MINECTGTKGWHAGTVIVGLLLAAGLVGLGPTGARAGPTPDELSEKAEAHYRQGQQHYADGNYRKAAEALRRAYALTPMPLLLYNICLAEWRAGNLDEATMMALRARREKLPPALHAKTDARLAAFGSIGTAQTMAGRLGDGNGGAEAGAEVSGDNEDELAEPKGQSGPSASEAGRRARFGGLGWVGVGATTLGAAGLTMAGLYDARVADAARRMNRASQEGDVAKAEEIRSNEVVPTQKTGKVFLFAGGGLAAGGLTLIVWDLATAPAAEKGASAERRLRPTIGFGQIGVTISY